MTDPINAALDRLQEYAAAHPEHDTDELVARARAAQAVLDAANGASSYGPDDCLNDARWIAAAALRALADAVVPEETSIVKACDFRRQRQRTRKQILSIAAKLEN